MVMVMVYHVHSTNKVVQENVIASTTLVVIVAKNVALLTISIPGRKARAPHGFQTVQQPVKVWLYSC